MDLEVWKEEGSKDMIQRASEKAIQIMEDYRPEPFDLIIELELKQIINSAEKKISRSR
jgi:trimethylamine:corrinoid methyltransferase-like protein